MAMGVDLTRRVRRGLTTVLVVVTAGGQLGSSCEAACEQPYRPVGTDFTPNGDEPPVGDWPVSGSVREPVRPVLDTDGDGAVDRQALSADERRLTIGRASGDLVLTVPEGHRVGNAFADTVTNGDLDGDGRSDVVLDVVDDATGTRTANVVAGATPDGTHAVADVAARPFATPPGQLAPEVVGDLDADGRDDVVNQVFVDGATPRVLVWPGADVDVTPGAGAVAASYDLAGRLASVVGLEGRNALGLDTGSQAWDQAHLEVSLWVPDTSLRFTTEGSAPLRVVPAAYPQVVQGGGQSWLVVMASDRSGVQRWAFDLDDLCAWAATTAPPVVPVAARAPR